MMAQTVRVELDEIVCHFEDLEDPRSTVNRRHPLTSVVVIALMAVLAGAGGPTAIARWAKMKEELLKTVLDLPHGVPRKDVFRRVLMALQPEAFQVCFANWLASLQAQAAAAAAGPGEAMPSKPRVLNVDGKTLRHRQLCGYLRSNQHRTDYPNYLARGWEIGSGEIEPACKTVVNRRLKGAGMRWREPGTTAVCQLRALFKSDPILCNHHWRHTSAV